MLPSPWEFIFSKKGKQYITIDHDPDCHPKSVISAGFSRVDSEPAAAPPTAPIVKDGPKSPAAVQPLDVTASLNAKSGFGFGLPHGASATPSEEAVPAYKPTGEPP